MSKCKKCNDTGYYYCPVLLIEQECYMCSASNELSKESIEEAAEEASKFGLPDICGGFDIEDGIVYFKDREGNVSVQITEEQYNIIVSKYNNRTRQNRSK